MAKRQKEKASETRQMLLDSALEIMCEKPFASVSMTEIAEKVNLSKGAIYWHFKSKSDVLVSLVEGMRACVEGNIDYDGKPFESIENMCLCFEKKMEKLRQRKNFLQVQKLMLHREEWPAEVREKVFRIIRDHAWLERHMVGRLVVKLQEEGVIRKDISPSDLSLIIAALFQGLFMLHLNDFFQVNFIKITNVITDIFTKGLSPLPDPNE